jgi:hypothetical protein
MFYRGCLRTWLHGSNTICQFRVLAREPVIHRHFRTSPATPVRADLLCYKRDCHGHEEPRHYDPGVWT